MIRKVMLIFLFQKNVIIFCDNLYAKKDLVVCAVDKYTNLGIICSARYDSIIYDTAQQPAI